MYVIDMSWLLVIHIHRRGLINSVVLLFLAFLAFDTNNERLEVSVSLHYFVLPSLTILASLSSKWKSSINLILL